MYCEIFHSSDSNQHLKSLHYREGPLYAVDQNLKWRLLFLQTHVN